MHQTDAALGHAMRALSDLAGVRRAFGVSGRSGLTALWLGKSPA